MKNLMSIDPTTHANIKVKASDLQHCQSQQICPALAQEFTQLAAEFVIVFIKNPKNNACQSVALLGTKTDENLYLQDGQWQANYVPAALRTYPFSLSRIENSDQMLVSLDHSSPLVNENEGDALFDDNGTQSEYFNKILSFLSHVAVQGQFTDAMSQYLNDNNLLEEQCLTITLNGKSERFTGVYRVDENKLDQLTNEQFIELRNKGYLSAVYAHLNSLLQVNTLHRLQMRAQTPIEHCL